MRLEDKLGVSLLERNNMAVRLANAGQRFLDDVQPALQQPDQARRSACAAGRAEACVSARKIGSGAIFCK